MLFHQRKHVYFFHLYCKILCFSNFLSCQTTNSFRLPPRQKRIWHVLAEGAVRNSEIDIHSNSRLDNDFHSTLVVYRKSFPIYGVRSADEKHGIGGKKKNKKRRERESVSILLLSGGHDNNELTILHLLIQQMDYFKLHKHF